MASEQDLLGTRVRHIRIVDFLGRGGMGSVYVGFDERLQRRVALKAIQEHRLDADARARFLREARLLSQLQHPNICQIHEYLEADGREFLVLELIQGRSLEEVVRSNPAPALRMRIARQLAQVLAATHAQGIIHRDLKPANVMLTAGDEVKVLDFGLARGTDRVMTETLGGEGDRAAPAAAQASDGAVTRLGAVVGTLTYMSPEQARGEPVTTASDMYSYGLILQELFTGQAAYAVSTDPLEQLARARAAQVLPVLGLDADLTALIRRLQDPALAVRPLALDTVARLDWIAQRPRRRLWRIAAWCAGGLLALVAGGMSYQAARIRQEAARANAEAARATREAEAAQQVSEFLVKLFRVSDPGESRGETVTARELLDQAGRQIEGSLADQPLIKARLMVTLARVYDALGLYDSALSFAQRSLELRNQSLPPTDALVGESLYWVGSEHYEKGDYARAEECLRRALAIRERALGPDHAAVGETVNDLALAVQEQGQLGDAESLFLRALEIDRRALGPAHPDVGAILKNLASLYRDQGRYARAEEFLRRAIGAREKALGPDHPAFALDLFTLALLLSDQGRYREAEALFKRALEIEERALGPGHPDLGGTLSNLGATYAAQGKYAEAERAIRRGLEIREKALGPNHTDVAASLKHLSRVRAGRGQLAEAQALLERALQITEKTLGPEHPDVAQVLATLAGVLGDQGQRAAAERQLRRALEIEERALGPDHPDVACVLVALADLSRRAGQMGSVGPPLERALAIFAKARTAEAEPRLRYRQALALALELAGRGAEARPLAQQLLGAGYRRPDFLRLCVRLGLAAGS